MDETQTTSPAPTTQAPEEAVTYDPERGAWMRGDEIVSQVEPEEVKEVDQPAEETTPDETPPLTRATFLAERDQLLETVRAGLDDPVDGAAYRNRLLAEIYVTSIETRLALVDLDAFLVAGRGFMESGPLKMLGGKLGRKGRAE